ncbi:related to Dihydrosphingosine 1-phosphate phosphatase YSR3 [Hanseniaspora guilliermondii]|uniref:Related to Dihydrosphingosine 1-phosphate phosphatase YSR3 n=1 Tax=Hanseniaspora guilliermondii TaxID=56406 RepID=A0A1L0B3S8_9ASCO|nr:related to Dihydrosphingosine 1-phosphate phosphatase YSR3 [Hanseniaspora guilliermondii]
MHLDDNLEKDENGGLVLKAIPESCDSEDVIDIRPRSRSNTVLSQMSSNTRMRKRSRTDSIASSIMEAVEQIKVHNEQTDVDTKDPGLKSDEYYKKRMNSLRYRLRSVLLKYVENETSPLIYIQEHFRNFILDEYFIYSANLGSHFFYVVCLPMTRWIPISQNHDYSRDLIYLLAFSIYLSGLIKDYLCLPRPKSPPIIRITHSEYTTKEYGAPSSHTANATAVTFYVVIQLCLSIKYFSFKQGLLFFTLTFMYYTTLTFGRLYSGMHGFFDLESGAVIGLFTLLARLITKNYLDKVLLPKSSIVYPIMHVLFGYCILFLHLHPVEMCPCYEDSVSFIGVVGGLEISDWLCTKLGKKYLPWVQSKNLAYLLPLPTSVTGDSLIKVISLRVLIGIGLVLLWKELITVIITKKVFKLKTTSILSSKTLKQHKIREFEPLPVTVVLLRYWIYAGIAIVACFVAPVIFSLCGLL